MANCLHIFQRTQDDIPGRRSWPSEPGTHTVDVLIDAFNHWDGSISLTLIVDNNISHRESCPGCHGAISCEHDRAAAIAEASSCRALFPACRCRFPWKTALNSVRTTPAHGRDLGLYFDAQVRARPGSNRR